jgi:integrase
MKAGERNMRVFRTNYKDRDGRKREAEKWYVELRDHNGIVRRLAAFTDKKPSEALGRNIESLVNCRSAGLEPDVKINKWIETVPDKLLKKFVSWGLIDGQRTEITKPLTAHISDYVKVLGAKGYSKDYVRRCRNRLKKIVSACRFTYFRDITQSAVQIYSGKLKKDGYGDTSRGHYLDALQTFLNWAEQDQRIIRNPIAKIVKPKRDSEKKGILTPEQFLYLLRSTFEKNVLLYSKHGISQGVERAVLYLLAGVTGLRRKELLSLTWADIYLTPDSAFVRVSAKLSKNSREAEQPIAGATVAVLQAYRAQQQPEASDRVFKGLSKYINTAELLRADLIAAKLPLVDREDNVICFHSLRNSYISFLANSQTPAKVVQKLARHSDPRLTFNTYARTFEKSEQQAVMSLPIFDGFVLARCLALLGGEHRITSDYIGNENSRNASKTALTAENQIPPRGVEPLSPG